MIKQQAGDRRQGAGISLVAKPVRRIEAEQGVREATTGRFVCMRPEVERKPTIKLLPRVWAVAEALETAVTAGKEDAFSVHRDDTAMKGVSGLESPRAEVAFYRKYTEAMLRRYVRLALQSGRVPSLLGRELFRGNVTHYQVRGFDDVVIFCFDMEKLLERLRPMDQKLIKRIAMQEYTQGETAAMLRMSLRSCLRAYGEAVDRLTEMLLEARMLEPLNSCQ